MYAHHAALWSASFDGRDRTSHHKRTKQRGKGDSWTWEGKGPWRQAGEYRHPKEELEAAKEERHRYEGTWLARKPERQKFDKLTFNIVHPLIEMHSR